MGLAVLLVALSVQSSADVQDRASLQTTVRVTPAQVERAVSEHVMDVPEFRFIREEAEKLGIRAWLFGGTAAGFAHYVKWDLQRRSGDTRYQADRFDYDFTNIYRSTQDLDIVVDGSVEKIDQLANVLAQKYPHFLGSNTKWEVRSLRESRGSPGSYGYKEALLDSFDFLNQHTDSNSTGLVEITKPNGDHPVKDLRDWNSSTPRFLRDVAEGRLSYYFAEKHFDTARAKKGLNPEIFSVMRALTKALQFDLSISKGDFEVMKQIIERFEDREIRSDALGRRFNDIALKLIKNAVNMEEAMNLLDAMGLRSKLRSFGRVDEYDSVAWWANKEPLRSSEVGRGVGKTARELGIAVVAHETNTFLAYESITRAHTGDPNVFISRKNVTGEAAVHGDGFYTKQGHEGARQTGLTIRFAVDPNARSGTDFTIRGDDYLIFHNKRAIRVIPESLNFTLPQYFDVLSSGEIKNSDRAILEKFRRRLTRMVQDVTPEEEKAIVEMVIRDIEDTKNSRQGPSALLAEFLKLPFAQKHSEVVRKMIEVGLASEAFGAMASWNVMPAKPFEDFIIENLNESMRRNAIHAYAGAFARFPTILYSERLLDVALEQSNTLGAVLVGLDNLRLVVEASGSEVKIPRVSRAHRADLKLAQSFFERVKGHYKDLSDWKDYVRDRHEDVELDFIKNVMTKGPAQTRVDWIRRALKWGYPDTVLSMVLPFAKIENWESVVREFFTGRNIGKGLSAIMADPRSLAFASDIEKFIRGKQIASHLLANGLAHAHWVSRPDLVRLLMMNEGGPEAISRYVMSQTHWQVHQDILSTLVKTDRSAALTEYVLPTEKPTDAYRRVKYLLSSSGTEEISRILDQTLSKPEWAKHPELLDVIFDVNMSEIQMTPERWVGYLGASVLHVFQSPQWQRHGDKLAKAIRLGYMDKRGREILKLVGSSPLLRRSDVPMAIVERFEGSGELIDQVLLHSDVANRVEVIRAAVEKMEGSVVRILLEKILTPESAWFRTPEILTRAIEKTEVLRSSLEYDQWLKFLTDKRLEGHREFAVAFLKNKNFSRAIIGDVLMSKVWSADESLKRIACETRPNSALYSKFRSLPDSQRIALYRLMLKSGPNEFLEELGTSDLTLTHEERTTLLDEILLRGKSREYMSAAHELARKLIGGSAIDRALLVRYVNQYGAEILVELYLKSNAGWTDRPEILRFAFAMEMRSAAVAEILLDPRVKNRIDLVSELIRSGKHSQAIETFFLKEPTWHRELINDFFFNPTTSVRQLDDLIERQEAKDELKWIEILVRRTGRYEWDITAPVIRSLPPSQELNHLCGGPCDLRKLKAVFAKGFTFLTDEEFRRAGFSPAALASKRFIRETVLRRTRPVTRCESLFAR